MSNSTTTLREELLSNLSKVIEMTDDQLADLMLTTLEAHLPDDYPENVHAGSEWNIGYDRGFNRAIDDVKQLLTEAKGKK